MSNDNETKISRRNFIALGSAGVAVAVAMPGSLFAAQPGASPLLLSIGYWGGSSVLEKVSDWRKPVAGQFDVVDAAAYEQGDYSFLQGAVLLNIAGMVGPRPASLSSLLLRANFNADQNGGTAMVPFDAWSYSNNGAEKVSPGVRFRMPIQPESSLSFSVEAEFSESRLRAARKGAASGATTKAEASNSLALSGSGPKLMRGVYFLAVTDSPVNWSEWEFSMKGTNDRSRRLVREGLTGVTPATFPYIVMTADVEVTK